MGMSLALREVECPLYIYEGISRYMQLYFLQPDWAGRRSERNMKGEANMTAFH